MTCGERRRTHDRPAFASCQPALRRFPPLSTIEEHNDACFIVKDATGQAIGVCLPEVNDLTSLRLVGAALDP